MDFFFFWCLKAPLLKILIVGLSLLLLPERRFSLRGFAREFLSYSFNLCKVFFCIKRYCIFLYFIMSGYVLGSTGRPNIRRRISFIPCGMLLRFSRRPMRLLRRLRRPLRFLSLLRLLHCLRRPLRFLSLLWLLCRLRLSLWLLRLLRLLRLLAPRAGRLLGPCLAELSARRALLVAVHVMLYGALFGAMAAGVLLPRATWNAMHFTRSVFSEGALGHIGRAYASGNILWATLATLHQNYLVGTCLYSALPSLVFPFAGLFKNLLSFGFVGFVMTPLWTGSAAQNTYHSITLTLELEAYVVVTFAVCALPIRVVRGWQSGEWATQYLAGLRIIVGAVALAGIMLTIAAVYEATTLILLH